MHVGALPLNYNSRSVRRLPFSTSGNYGPVCTENLIPWRRGRIGEGAILPLLVLLRHLASATLEKPTGLQRQAGTGTIKAEDTVLPTTCKMERP